MAEYTDRSTNMEYVETDVDTVNISSLIQALERINTLVGPAKEEITTLAARHRALHGSTSITELQSQLEKTRGENEVLHKQLEAKNQSHTAQCAELDGRLQHVIEQFNELQASAKNEEHILINKHKEEINAFKEVNQRTETELQAVLREKEKALKSIEDLKVKANNKIQQQKTENEQLKRSLNHFKAEKEKIERDLSDTKSRLSKLMGDKLSDKNPDIADLSDDKRPTKLAEQYQELYDNEWTDAFEVAEKYFPATEESFRIQELLKILMEVYKFCEREIENQDKELMQAMYRSNPQTTRQDLPDNVKAQLKEIKRLTATGAIENLKKKYFEEVDREEKVEGFSVKVKTYVEDCISLCWMMVRQDPPLVLHTNVEIGDQFDSNKYKPYTSTGTIVEFVVWPALFLHQNGPLLSKGVVQCINKLQGSKSVKARSHPVDKLSVVSSASMRLTGNNSSTDTTNRFPDGNHNAKSSTQTQRLESEQTKQILKPPITATVQQGVKTTFLIEKIEQLRNKYTSQDHNYPAQHMKQSKGHETKKGFGFNDPACSKQDNINVTSASVSIQHNQPTAVSHRQGQYISTDNEMNPQTPSNPQQNQPTAGSYRHRETVSTDNEMNPQTPSNPQQNQPTAGSHRHRVTVSTDNEMNQKTPSNPQQNQPTAGSHRHRESVSTDNEMNQKTPLNPQQNQPTAGSHRHRESVSTGNEMNQKTPSNPQQNQPIDSVVKSFDPLVSQSGQSSPYPNVTGLNQSQSSTDTYTATILQSSHSTNAYHDVNQHTLVPYYWSAIQYQYPAHLIPTNSEYNDYVWYNKQNGYPELARYFLGAQVYDKCNNYINWIQPFIRT